MKEKPTPAHELPQTARGQHLMEQRKLYAKAKRSDLVEVLVDRDCRIFDLQAQRDEASGEANRVRAQVNRLNSYRTNAIATAVHTFGKAAEQFERILDRVVRAEREFFVCPHCKKGIYEP